MAAQLQGRRYSGKVRALGYVIIILELATVVVFFLAVYGNVMTSLSITSSLSTGSSGGNPFGLQNVTSNGQIERAFVIPNISNKGYLPVTLKVDAVFLDVSNRTIGTPLSESLTVAAGQTQPLIIRFSGISSSSDVASARVSFQVSSLFGLVGMGATATLSK